jgi:Spy/CpxP family protein refolding chaperone
MKRYALPAFYLLVVFFCGLAVGVFGYRFYELKTVSANVTPPPRPTPEEWKRHHLEELKSRLNLTADQVTQISNILEEAHSQMRALMEKNRPEMERIQKNQYARVKALLTPRQATEYDKFHAEREKRRGERRGPF